MVIPSIDWFPVEHAIFLLMMAKTKTTPTAEWVRVHPTTKFVFTAFDADVVADLVQRADRW